MYLLNNVTHHGLGAVTLDLPTAGVNATRYSDGSVVLRLAESSGSAIMSRPSANLLAELIAGNLDEPEPTWGEGDVVTFRSAAPVGGGVFAIQRRADGEWVLHRNGKVSYNGAASGWKDHNVDELVSAKYAGMYSDATVVIRGAR